MKISKKAIMRQSGWSETQYKREYAKFSAKVKNLNRLAGTHYNASNELYYSLKEPNNKTVRSIQEMSSARKGTTMAMRETAKEYVGERFRGLMQAIPELRELYDKIGIKQPTSTGKMRKYSLRQFNAFVKRGLKKIEKNRRIDPLYNYEDAFKEEFEMLDETQSTIYDVNEEYYDEIFDIL